MPAGDAGAEPLNRQLDEYAEPGGGGEEAPLGKGRQPLHGLSRQLSPEDLRQTGTQKMILDLLDRLQDENELKEFKEKFHERDKEVAVLRERLKKSTAQDIVIGAMLAGGSLVLGYLPSLLLPTGLPSPTGWIALVIGGLFSCGITSGMAVLKRPTGSSEKKQ